MSATVSKILTLTYYLIESYLLKRSIYYTSATQVLLESFMNFSEVATGCVLWKKLLLKISQHSQESCRPATLLKADSNTGVFLWILHKFYQHLFQRTPAWSATASALTPLLSSDIY